MIHLNILVIYNGESDSNKSDIKKPEEDNITMSDIDYEALEELNRMSPANIKDNTALHNVPDDLENEDYDINTSKDMLYAFNDLKELSTRKKSDDDEDIEEAFQRQYISNRNNTNVSSITGISLIDDPVELSIAKDVKGPGDDNNIRLVKTLVIALVFCVFLSPFLAVYFANMERDNEEVTASSGQNISIGDLIDNNGSIANSNNNSGEQSQSALPPSTDTVDVPEGGSKITYEISTEGDIRSASVAWVSGVGQTENQAGVTLPWSISIGAQANTNPVLAATTTGSGTVTCKILQDDVQIATKSASGDSPEVTCEQ